MDVHLYLGKCGIYCSIKTIESMDVSIVYIQDEAGGHALQAAGVSWHEQL